jgi:hypothetical protein
VTRRASRPLCGHATRSFRLWLCGVGASALPLLCVSAGRALAPSVTYRVGAITDISTRCGGQNAEVEQAVDPVHGYVYEAWIGCTGIGFARSRDGGRHFSKPVALRASRDGWDPALAVAADGTVYAAFMVTRGTKNFPVILASVDHGGSFPRLARLTPQRKSNWGDRVFLSTGPADSVYVTWDYGPSNPRVKLRCLALGSCALVGGELNIVMQASSNSGRSFGPMVHLSPGFPASGGESAPLVVEPNGRIDVLYERSKVFAHRAYALGAGRTYFTSSADGGRTWTQPVAVGASAGTIAPREWWIDGALAIDAAGNLYATWDTQARHSDTGWLSYSTDHGVTWSHPIEISTTRGKLAHIVEVAGGPPGIAHVAWLSNPRPGGYAAFLRSFSIAHSWLSPPRRISRQFGDPHVWPGDTFGISTLSPSDIVLSWGSATRSTRRNSQIFTTRVGVTLPVG